MTSSAMAVPFPSSVMCSTLPAVGCVSGLRPKTVRRRRSMYDRLSVYDLCTVYSLVGTMRSNVRM
jgi:hypothetical protein